MRIGLRRREFIVTLGAAVAASLPLLGATLGRFRAAVLS